MNENIEPALRENLNATVRYSLGVLRESGAEAAVLPGDLWGKPSPVLPTLLVVSFALRTLELLWLRGWVLSREPSARLTGASMALNFALALVLVRGVVLNRPDIADADEGAGEQQDDDQAESGDQHAQQAAMRDLPAGGCEDSFMLLKSIDDATADRRDIPYRGYASTRIRATNQRFQRLL